jgi:hypothetical protein
MTATQINNFRCSGGRDVGVSVAGPPSGSHLHRPLSPRSGASLHPVGGATMRRPLLDLIQIKSVPPALHSMSAVQGFDGGRHDDSGFCGFRCDLVLGRPPHPADAQWLLIATASGSRRASHGCLGFCGFARNLYGSFANRRLSCLCSSRCAWYGPPKASRPRWRSGADRLPKGCACNVTRSEEAAPARTSAHRRFTSSIAGWISTGSLTACGRGSWLATPTCPLFASAARMPARSCFTCDPFRRRE